MLRNIKAFIMSICLAVVFTILLVSANTMAMSIRERTREVAVLKTLGFTRNSILGLFVGEAVSLSLIGGLVGSLLCYFIVTGMASQGGMFTGMKVTPITILVALLIAAVVGFASSFVPSYHAAKVYIVRNLRLRKSLTIMTALGIALTVATAVFIMALLAGLGRAFATTGDPLNVLMLRKGSDSELAAGGVSRDAVQVLKDLPGVK